MSINPFSPSFSINPRAFFGRASYLNRYRSALRAQNSADRFFFLLGTCGCGKTALLHQYALQAAEEHWDVLETTGVDALNRVVHYARSGGGADGHAGGSFDLELSTLGDQLARILSRRTDARPRGALLIAIDETQEAEQDAIERVCNAAQQVRSRGFDISLILSGVPLSHPRICSFEHCVFVNRMECVRLGCMSKAETVTFLQEGFRRMPEVQVTRQQLATLAAYTHGHPYLMQLVGDMTWRVAQASPEQRHALDPQDVSWICAESLRRYRTDVLSSILVGVPDETIDYLHAVADLRDRATGLASVSEVSARVGSGASFASALDTQIVDCPTEGFLRLTIPYFDYAFADPISASMSAHPTMQALNDWVF